MLITHFTLFCSTNRNVAYLSYTCLQILYTLLKLFGHILNLLVTDPAMRDTMLH